MKISKVGALAGVAVLTFAACGGGAATTAPSGSSASASSGGASGGASPSAAGGTDKGTVKIAIELPLQGSETRGGAADHQRHPAGHQGCRRRRGRLRHHAAAGGRVRRRGQRRA